MGKFYYLKSLHKGLWVIPIDTVIGPFNYAEQDGYTKIFIDSLLGKEVHVVAAGCPPVTFNS